jgi:hypothetical protein
MQVFVGQPFWRGDTHGMNVGYGHLDYLDVHYR